MAKVKARYVCQSCGSVSHRWQGQCADCAEWNTLVQESAEVSSIFAAKHNLQGGGRVIPLVGLETPAAPPGRLPSGITEFDRAIGGGIVAVHALRHPREPALDEECSAREQRQMAARSEVVGEPDATGCPGDEPGEPEVPARGEEEERDPGYGERAGGPCDLSSHGATTTSARALWPRSETTRW